MLHDLSIAMDQGIYAIFSLHKMNFGLEQFE